MCYKDLHHSLVNTLKPVCTQQEEERDDRRIKDCFEPCKDGYSNNDTVFSHVSMSIVLLCQPIFYIRLLLTLHQKLNQASIGRNSMGTTEDEIR